MALRGYRARWIIDGTGGPIHPGTVLVEDAWVVEVVRRGQLPSDAEIVDLGDAAILPGLIDAHVHLIWAGAAPNPEEIRARESVPMGTVRAVRHAADTLLGGTTTVRDVGCPNGVAFAVRDAVNAGVIPGPRILAAGAPLVMTGGHCHPMGVEVDGPYEARKAARQQLKEGADLLKMLATGGVYGLHHDEPWSPQLELDELQAAVAEARKAHRVAAIHAEGEQGIATAIEAGADTIEHGNQLTRELAEKMAKRGVFLVPTLAWFFNVAEATPGPTFNEEYVRKGRLMAEASARGIMLAKTAGVKIAAGTDTGAPLVPHNSVRREIELLVRLGLTPHEAIQSATRVAAEALRVDGQVGTLEQGKFADLIVVGGDPTADPHVLYDLRMVMKGGKIVQQSAGSGATGLATGQSAGP
ncbi:MAG: amidohydrolase family protein [Chloroflexi bacterium]|nr:amidohydrolase family protein [Chloroflexota bacterium]